MHSVRFFETLSFDDGNSHSSIGNLLSYSHICMEMIFQLLFRKKSTKQMN